MISRTQKRPRKILYPGPDDPNLGAKIIQIIKDIETQRRNDDTQKRLDDLEADVRRLKDLMGV